MCGYADVTAPVNNGSSPLHWGGQNEIQDLERLLVNHFENLAATDKDGSVLNGDVDVVRLLVKHGADVTANDNHPWTPAVMNGRVELTILRASSSSTVRLDRPRP